jgi:uncharacterized membrane protein
MRNTLQWLILFEDPVDTIGFGLFLLVFPVYHAVYPFLIRLFPQHSAKARVDAFRRSWIEGLLERRDIIAAAQQTRNLTMVNSLLASSALILMGVTANVLIRYPQLSESIIEPEQWSQHPDAQAVKLFLLIIVFAVAFSYCMTSLRHLGHFNLVIGADPELISELEGPPVDYFSTLVNRASNRYTLAVRCFYSASPLFLWLFDSWFFIALSFFWGIKFIGFQDFGHVLGQSERKTA